MKLLVPYLIALSMGLLSCSGPSEVVTDDGVTLSYQIAGDGDTTVLFLHGWCIDKTYWDSQVSRLDSRYKVVTIDHAGHGASKGSHAEWTPARLGKDISQAIDQLGLRNIVLVGHSMSGTIMLETHAIAGDRVIGLIGVDNFKELTPALTEPQSKEMKEFLGYFSSNYTSVATEYVKASLFTESSPPQAVERVLADVLRMDSVVSVEIIAQLVTWGPREIELLRQLPVPLLLINSSATPTDTIALDKECVSGFRLFDAGPTGHYPMIESPDRFNEAMEEALTLIGRGK